MNQAYELSGVLGFSIALAVLVVVFLVCLQVLPQMGFDGASRRALAISVALLSAAGLFHTVLASTSHGAAESDSSTYHFLLLPYEALGLTLLALLPLLFIVKSIDAGKRRRTSRRTSRSGDNVGPAESGTGWHTDGKSHPPDHSENPS